MVLAVVPADLRVWSRHSINIAHVTALGSIWHTMDDSTPEELDRLREGVRRIVGDEFIGKFRDGDFLLLLSERFADEKDLRAATSDQLRSIKLPAALIAHLKKGECFGLVSRDPSRAIARKPNWLTQAAATVPLV